MNLGINEQKESLFSFAKLNAITCGDQDAMRHFNQVFIQETLSHDLNSLKESVEKRDYAEVNRVAHKMKSSIDLYCIDSVSEEIRKIEDLAAMDEELDKIPEILSLIEPRLIRVREEITALL
jgi:HPt (histidine-containing phosphotransfer) domain-containing protein